MPISFDSEGVCNDSAPVETPTCCGCEVACNGAVPVEMPIGSGKDIASSASDLVEKPGMDIVKANASKKFQAPVWLLNGWTMCLHPTQRDRMGNPRKAFLHTATGRIFSNAQQVLRYDKKNRSQ